MMVSLVGTETKILGVGRMKLRNFVKQEKKNQVNLAIDKRDGSTSSIKLTICNYLHSSLWLRYPATSMFERDNYSPSQLGGTVFSVCSVAQ